MQINRFFSLLLVCASPLCRAETDIRSAAEPNYPPLSVVNSDGHADGFAVEMLRAALKEMGRNVVIDSGSWQDIKQQLADGKIDVLPLAGRTPEREAVFDFTIPYLTLHGALFVRDDSTGIHTMDDLKDKRIAVMRGDNAEEYIRRANLSEHILTTPDFEEAFRMLSDGRADAVVAQKLMGITLLKKLNITNVRITGKPNQEFRQDFCFAVKSGNKKLLSVLNEGLALITANGTARQLQQKWLGRDERTLALARTIIYGGNLDFPPYEFLDEKGRPAGFTVELTRAIARELGVNIAIELAPWSETVRKLEHGELDVSSMQYTPSRGRQFSFSTPFSTMYQAIFARNDAPPYRRFGDLSKYRIAVRNASVMYDYALRQGLSNSLVITERPEDALHLLIENKADYALLPYWQGVQEAEKNGWKNLHAVEKRLTETEYCYTTAAGNTELINLLNDGLARLKESGEYRNIYNKWMGVLEPDSRREQTKKILMAFLAFFALPAMAGGGIIFALNRTIKRRTAELELANRTLNDSRLAALNMMEDAIEAKNQLEESQTRLRLTQFSLDHSGDAVFWVDSAERFFYVNEAACRSLGYTRDELLQLSVKDINPGFPQEKWPTFWEKLKEKESLVFEACHKTKTGQTVPVEIHAGFITFGSLECICAFVHDISDRKRREAELQRLSTAIGQSPEAVMITGPDGIIQYVNPAFETISGFSRQEAIGKNPRILKSGQHDAVFYSNLWKTIGSGRNWEGRFINKRKNGKLYTEEATVSPVRDSSGNITGYVAVKRDITEELGKEEQYRQAQKMEAVGQLAGGIAHDFNNILQAILGFSEILLTRLASDTVEYRNVDEIQKAAKRAAELTRQLLAFSRKQPAEKKLLQLNSTLQDTEVLLQLLLGEKVRCSLKLTPDLHPVYADHGHITQIILNLAVNARDAMPDGGLLTISTENILFTEQNVPAHPDARQGNFICLSIADTGTGLSPEVKDHLFEPFFTTKGIGKGTGLGLSVIYGIVKQSKGWIQVESEEGRGTVFKIYLPACEPGALSADSHVSPDGSTDQRILLVEDDPAMRDMVLRLLQNAEYQTFSAGNLKEAERIFEQERGRFDLLFSDIVLPDGNGVELADNLRKKKPGFPVLLYSGYQNQRERWDNLDSKGYHFLQKPFTVTALLAMVHDILTEAKK